MANIGSFSAPMKLPSGEGKLSLAVSPDGTIYLSAHRLKSNASVKPPSPNHFPTHKGTANRYDRRPPAGSRANPSASTLSSPFPASALQQSTSRSTGADGSLKELLVSRERRGLRPLDLPSDGRLPGGPGKQPGLPPGRDGHGVFRISANSGSAQHPGICPQFPPQEFPCAPQIRKVFFGLPRIRSRPRPVAVRSFARPTILAIGAALGVVEFPPPAAPRPRPIRMNYSWEFFCTSREHGGPRRRWSLPGTAPYSKIGARRPKRRPRRGFFQ